MSGVSFDNALLLQEAVARCSELIASDPEARDALPPSEFLETLDRTCRSSIEFFARACDRYSQRPALGWRPFEVVDGRPRRSSAFHTINYVEVWARVVRLATGWWREGIVRTGEFVGICAFGGPEVTVAELACLYLGAVSVSLQANSSLAALKHIVTETQMTCIVCDVEQVAVVAGVVQGVPTVRTLLVADVDDRVVEHQQLIEQIRVRVRGAGVSVHIQPLNELESAGAGTPVPMVVASKHADPLRTIVYTSGSTGEPKGATFHESTWAEHWRPRNADTFPFVNALPRFPLVTVLCVPLFHIMARRLLGRSLVHGGLVHYTSKSDLSAFFDDLQAAQPTYLYFVPRVADIIYERHRMTAAAEPPPAREAAAEMRRRYVGARMLVTGYSAGRPSTAVADFIRGSLRLPLFDQWASTEIGGIAFEHRVCRQNIVHYKLVPVPQLGYELSDRPYPRGELRVKALRATQGYYKNVEATRALVDEDGYVKTGDVVEERGPDEVHWVGRLNDVVKLAQGEFVVIWKLESTYGHDSQLIDQVFLYAVGHRSYLVGVVVPNLVHTQGRLGGSATDPNEVKELLVGEIHRISRERHLQPFEVLRDFVVEPQPFTKENGLLTGAGKLARSRLTAKYRDTLEALCTQIDKLEDDRLLELQRLTTHIARVRSLLADTKGVRDVAVTLRDDAPGRVRLVAYVVGDPRLDIAALRELVHAAVSQNELSTVVMAVDALPLTPTGELDRSVLPPPPEAPAAEYVAPSSESEIALARIWKDVLGVERVGAGDNFLDLGGHSLLATQVVNRIRQELGLQLSIADVFEAESLASLATRVEGGADAPAQTDTKGSAR